VREAELRRSNGSRQPDEPQRPGTWVPVGACTMAGRLVDFDARARVPVLPEDPILGLVHAHLFGLFGGGSGRARSPPQWWAG
jgi:hypothetical protein